MKSENENQKWYLECQRKNSPLHPKWLKTDYVTASQAVLIFYNVEPGASDFHDETIRLIDFEGLYHVLLSSEFLSRNRHSFKLAQFAHWLTEKGYKVPSHLLENLSDIQTGDEDEMDLSIPDLKKRFVRTYCAYFWKKSKGEEAKWPAEKLAKHKEFETVISFVDLEVTEKTPEMFSDLSPRSSKQKNKRNKTEKSKKSSSS